MDPVGRLERLLEATARKLSGGEIHPIELLDRVATVLGDGAANGIMPNDITVGLSERDLAAYDSARGALATEIEALASRVERERRLRRIGPIAVAIVASPSASPGDPRITARFSEHAGQPLTFGAGSGEPTRRLRRQIGMVVVANDGTRAPLTHTPFTIGRAQGNDLVVASLALSRKHAEIVETDAGYVIRDLGGRNGLVVEGATVAEATLEAGTVAVLGDVLIWLEAEA